MSTCMTCGENVSASAVDRNDGFCPECDAMFVAEEEDLFDDELDDTWDDDPANEEEYDYSDELADIEVDDEEFDE